MGYYKSMVMRVYKRALIFAMFISLTGAVWGQFPFGDTQPPPNEEKDTEPERLGENPTTRGKEYNTTEYANYLANKPKILDAKARVLVIPIKSEDEQLMIGKTTTYIVRRGVKMAIEQDYEAVVLDIDTPGGRVDQMLEILGILDKFEQAGGHTIAYVNDEAISAGAFISVGADDIYFAPGAIMGAAAAIQSTGQDIPETMKAKLYSYLRAKIRAISDDHPFKGDVMRAMMETDFELVIDDKVIDSSGDLLSLTADEAMEEYGDPAVPLLATGIVNDVNELLTNEYGEDNYVIQRQEVTWSEELAYYMELITPLLLGVGFLALLLEFYTPGFGFAGITGLVCLAIVFLSNYVAGLAGYEAILALVAGIVLLAIELFVLPGTIVFGLTGVFLIAGSIVWSLADIWPTEGGGVEVTWDALVDPLYQLFYGLLIATVLFVAVYRFLPKRVMSALVLRDQSAPADAVAAAGGLPSAGTDKLPDAGAKGVVTRAMHPVGEVEIDEQRYDATVRIGSLPKGERIVVVGYRNFALLVDKDDTA